MAVVGWSRTLRDTLSDWSKYGPPLGRREPEIEYELQGPFHDLEWMQKFRVPRNFDLLVGIICEHPLVLEIGNFYQQLVPANSKFLDFVIPIYDLCFTGVSISTTTSARIEGCRVQLLVAYLGGNSRRETNSGCVCEISTGRFLKIKHGQCLEVYSHEIDIYIEKDSPAVPCTEKLLAVDPYIDWLHKQSVWYSFTPSLCKKARDFAKQVRHGVELRALKKKTMLNRLKLWLREM